MPEHVHLVLLPAEGVRISRILWVIKRPVAKRCIDWVKANSPGFLPKMAGELKRGTRVYHFWQNGGGYDRNLRSTADVHEKINYIHNNPVRRKLVERPEDYLWSSAKAWADGIDSPIPIDRQSLPILRK
jgi:putative transposase